MDTPPSNVAPPLNAGVPACLYLLESYQNILYEDIQQKRKKLFRIGYRYPNLYQQKLSLYHIECFQRPGSNIIDVNIISPYNLVTLSWNLKCIPNIQIQSSETKLLIWFKITTIHVKDGVKRKRHVRTTSRWDLIAVVKFHLVYMRRGIRAGQWQSKAMSLIGWNQQSKASNMLCHWLAENSNQMHWKRQIGITT